VSRNGKTGNYCGRFLRIWPICVNMMRILFVNSTNAYCTKSHRFYFIRQSRRH
jgi:hypothetical protein